MGRFSGAMTAFQVRRGREDSLLSRCCQLRGYKAHSQLSMLLAAAASGQTRGAPLQSWDRALLEGTHVAADALHRVKREMSRADRRGSSATDHKECSV